MGFSQKAKDTKLKSPNSAAAFVSVWILWCCSQSRQVLHEMASTQNLLHHWGVTPIQWHIPSIKTGCQDTLHENACRALTLYGGKCVLSLQTAHTARFCFSLSTGHYAQSSGSACCVLVVTVCLRFHRESWQPQCVWACQYKPRPQLTRICVSLHNKTFFFFFLQPL